MFNYKINVISWYMHIVFIFYKTIIIRDENLIIKCKFINNKIYILNIEEL